jgi:cell division protein FtsW
VDRKLLYSATALVIFGLIMVYSSSSVLAESRFGSNLFFLKRQFLWLLIGSLIGCLMYKIDLKKLAAYSVPLLIAGIILLAIVFLMPARNGSHRWLFLGPVSVQPSELFKLALIMYLAFSLSLGKRDITDWRQLLYPYGLFIAVGLILIILEPGLGSAITISLTVLIIFFLAGVRLYHLAIFIMPLTSLAAFMIFVIGYKSARVYDYIASIMSPLSGSYQVKQAVLTLGAGGLFGSGLGNGRQKLFFLPYPHTDFIFASIGEEVGFIGLSLLLFLFYIVIWRGISIARYQPDRFGYLLAMGVTASIFVSVFVNICVVTALLPTTGIPLPLISYGGTALVVSICSIAILLNLSKRKGMVVR